MNGRVAKALRKKAYGKDGSIRNRGYYETNVKKYKAEIEDATKKESLLKKGFDIMQEAVKGIVKEFKVWTTQTLVCDEKRRNYQNLKKQYYERRTK